MVIPTLFIFRLVHCSPLPPPHSALLFFIFQLAHSTTNPLYKTRNTLKSIQFCFLKHTLQLHIMQHFLKCMGLLLCIATVVSDVNFARPTSTPFELLASIHENVTSPNHTTSSRLYYIYPWNKDYYWRFPLDNSTCKDVGLQHYMMENSGYLPHAHDMHILINCRLSSSLT